MKPANSLRSRASPATVTTTSLTPAETTLLQGTNTVLTKTPDMIAFTTQNLEAVTTATKIWTAGVQDLTTRFATITKSALEESLAAFKALTSVKSVKEAIDLQSAYSKNIVAMTLAETTSLTDASLKLTEQTLAPVTARMAATVEVFSKAA